MEKENAEAFKLAKKRERLEKKETRKQQAIKDQEEAEAHITSYINKE